MYGLTESCGPACLISPDEALHARRLDRQGVLLHTDVRVVDEAGDDVAARRAGRGDLPRRPRHEGYWNRPEATAETIVDGWLHTGDVAIVDADGYVYIHDRIKDMIISGGENIYPAEIENVLLGHPTIATSRSSGSRSSAGASRRWPSSCARTTSLTEADVLAVHARASSPATSSRGRRVFVDEIPRNPSGKMLKRVLREQFPDPAP